MEYTQWNMEILHSHRSKNTVCNFLYLCNSPYIHIEITFSVYYLSYSAIQNFQYIIYPTLISYMVHCHLSHIFIYHTFSVLYLFFNENLCPTFPFDFPFLSIIYETLIPTYFTLISNFSYTQNFQFMPCYAVTHIP